MKRIVTALLISLVTALYWWIVFAIVYANVLFAGDRDPASQGPSDAETMTNTAVGLTVGVLLYAVLLLLYGKITNRSRPNG